MSVGIGDRVRLRGKHRQGVVREMISYEQRVVYVVEVDGEDFLRWWAAEDVVPVRKARR